MLVQRAAEAGYAQVTPHQFRHTFSDGGQTGLTVKTIRFYSDHGIVVPARRSPAGYRLYGIDALARLELVRTLRDLGIDLQTVRKVVNRAFAPRGRGRTRAGIDGADPHLVPATRGADRGGQTPRNPAEMNLMPTRGPVAPKSVLERLFALLDSFTDEEPELTLAQLSARTGIPKSTVHRLTKLLVEQRVLKRTDTGFALGLRLFELGELAGDRRQAPSPASIRS